MFNTTHHIKKLSFGTEIDSAPDGLYTSPLDGYMGLAKEGINRVSAKTGYNCFVVFYAFEKILKKC